MKRICLFALIWSIAALAPSCADDDLEQAPDEPDYSLGYRSAEDAWASIDSLYRNGAPAFFGGSTTSEIPAAMLGGYLSGYFENYTDTGTGLWESCRDLTLGGADLSSWVSGVWDQAYGAIRTCNAVIAAAPNTRWLTDEQRESIVAEARFFRAFNYFYLVRYFGGVPIVTDSDGNTNGSGSVSDVYELITGDLEAASDELPNDAFSRNGFRVSRPTVQTLLADVRLTMSGWPLRGDYYAEAAEAARNVIRGGKHSLASNGPTPEESAWNKLRTQDDNAEHIFSIEANPDYSLAAFCLPDEATTWGVVKTDTADAYAPVRSLMDIYDTYNDMRSRDQQMFHSFVKYEYGTRTVIQTFSPKSHWWFDRGALFETGISDNDVTIYRYAEVLLIAAEAISMTEGVTPEAAGYLADVRARAYPNIARESVLAEVIALSPEKFVEEVWVERLREFPFEMKIWPDIQRTLKYPKPVSGGKGDVMFIDVVGASNPSGVSFEQKHLLLPTP